MKEIQKAIKHFVCVRDGAVAVLDSGFGRKPNESDSLYKNRKLYSELAISALKKQIPKKPTHIINDDYAECPACGNANFEYGIRNWGCKYCPDCGQALDWSKKGGETDA